MVVIEGRMCEQVSHCCSLSLSGVHRWATSEVSGRAWANEVATITLSCLIDNNMHACGEGCVRKQAMGGGDVVARQMDFKLQEGNGPCTARWVCQICTWSCCKRAMALYCSTSDLQENDQVVLQDGWISSCINDSDVMGMWRSLAKGEAVLCMAILQKGRLCCAQWLWKGLAKGEGIVHGYERVLQNGKLCYAWITAIVDPARGLMIVTMTLASYCQVLVVTLTNITKIAET